MYCQGVVRRAGVGSRSTCYYLIIMQPEISKQEGRLAPLHKVTPLSKYLALALFISMPFIGGWIGYTYAPEEIVSINHVYAPEEIVRTSKEYKPSIDTEIAREIIPGGYVINDSLFYSPELDLAFTGRLNSLAFKDGLFYEDRMYGGKPNDEVTEEDILFWDYIKVFPKVSTEIPPEDVLKDLIRAEGKDPANCLISSHNSSEAELSPWLDPRGTFYIQNRDTYKIKYPEEEFYQILTQEEVYNILKPKSDFSSDKTEHHSTYSTYKEYCESGDGWLPCSWDYDLALGIKDADMCSKYAANASGGFFLFSDGEEYTHDEESGGFNIHKRNEMPFYFVRTIDTRDLSPWLWNAVTGIENVLR